MATFTTNKGYITQAFGENAGTWGTTLNSQMIEYVDRNIGGTYSLSITSPSGVAPNGTFTISSTDNQNAILILSGSPTYATWTNITITVNDLKGFLFVQNDITLPGGQTQYPEIRIKSSLNATYAVVPQGQKAILIADSSNGVRIAAQTYTNLVNTFSAGSTGLTPSTGTTGDVTLAGTLNVANGGTGLTTLTANNVILGNGTSTPQFVAPGTSGNFLTSNGTTWASETYNAFTYDGIQTIPSSPPLVKEINFNNVIPSTAKRVTLLFYQVSQSSGDEILIRLGYGALPTYETSGYVSNGSNLSNATNGFLITSGSGSGTLWTGKLILDRFNSNSDIWIASANVISAGGTTTFLCGYKSMPSTLNSVKLRLTGTQDLDNGQVNLMWES